MTTKIVFILSLACTLLIAGCGSTKEEKPQPVDTSAFSEGAKPAEQTPAAKHPGEQVYKSYCATCHQANGKGVSGMYPPLTSSVYIENKDSIIHVVLNGLKGEIEVEGETYNNYMAPHSHLSDQEVATVISYVRSSFGNNYDPVTEADVASVRKK